MRPIKLDKDKFILPSNTLTYYLNPDFIYIPISKSNLLVAQDEGIYKNQVVSKNKVLCPVSGHAIGLKVINHKNILVIANDFRELTKEKKGKKKELSVPYLLKLLEASNYKKLLDKFKCSKSYSTILVNVINDSPYVYNKIFMLKENLGEVLDLVENIRMLYQGKVSLITVKNNDAFIIDECLNVIGSFPNIKLTLVDDEYLLEEEMFIRDKLKLKTDCLYLDIKELCILNDLLKNKVTTTKIITISGDAIKENKILRVKKYTLLKDVIDKFIEIKDESYNIIVNGLLKGYEIKDMEEVIIDEKIESINIMKKTKSKRRECIKCGNCIKICPMKVNPITGKNKDKCIDCGLCSYICPSHINIRKKLGGKD